MTDFRLSETAVPTAFERESTSRVEDLRLELPIKGEISPLSIAITRGGVVGAEAARC